MTACWRWQGRPSFLPASARMQGRACFAGISSVSPHGRILPRHLSLERNMISFNKSSFKGCIVESFFCFDGTFLESIISVNILSYLTFLCFPVLRIPCDFRTIVNSGCNVTNYAHFEGFPKFFLCILSYLFSCNSQNRFFQIRIHFFSHEYIKLKASKKKMMTVLCIKTNYFGQMSAVQ